MSVSVPQALDYIRTIIDTLHGIEDIELLREQIGGVLSAYFPTNSSLLCVREAHQKSYVVWGANAGGQARTELRQTTVGLEEGVLRAALDSDDILYTKDIQKDDRFVEAFDSILGVDYVIGHTFLVPLHASRGEPPLGLLALYNFKMEEDVVYYRSLLMAFASILSFTIERLHLVHELRQEALTDHLTGLSNRRALSSIAAREIEQCLRYSSQMSFVLIDVDNFKLINDTDGHLHGDSVLRQIADILRKSVRRLDYVIRFAGDEFIILMPDTPHMQKKEAVWRLKENFTQQKLPSSVDYSISIGSYSGRPQSLQQMFVAADKEMYKEKLARKSTATVRRTIQY